MSVHERCVWEIIRRLSSSRLWDTGSPEYALPRCFLSSRSHRKPAGLLPFTIKRCASVGISLPSSALTLASDLAYQIPTSTYTLPTPTDLTNAPIDVADLPFCVVRTRTQGINIYANGPQKECVYQAAAFGNCDIHNRTCICTSEEFSAYANVCQTALCTADDLQGVSIYIIVGIFVIVLMF